MIALTLRPLRPADHPAALDLWVEAWSAAIGGVDFAARRPWLADRLAGLEREGASAWAACDGDGTLAGFSTVNAGTRYLDQLAVRPPLQGLGVATALLDHAKTLSPEGLDLHVNQDNPRALRFYEREGFRRIAADTNARSGLPVWLMRWP